MCKISENELLKIIFIIICIIIFYYYIIKYNVLNNLIGGEHNCSYLCEKEKTDMNIYNLEGKYEPVYKYNCNSKQSECKKKDYYIDDVFCSINNEQLPTNVELNSDENECCVLQKKAGIINKNQDCKKYKVYNDNDFIDQRIYCYQIEEEC